MTHKLFMVAPSAYLYGGLATWLDYLEPGLRKRDWQVTVGLVEGAFHHQPKKYTQEHSHLHWVPVSCYTATPEGRSRVLIKSVLTLQPQLVVGINIADVYPAVDAVRQKGRPDIKAAMAIHGIQPDLNEDISNYANALSGVVCTNRLACRLAKRLAGLPDEMIQYAPCGVDIPIVEGQRIKSDILRIGYVGRLDQWQKRIHDIPVILEYLEKFQVPFRMLIAGDGPEERALHQALQNLKSSQRIRMFGRVHSKELPREVYDQIDVLLLTSSWETGPIVVWEAMARQIPVVTSQYIGSGAEAALVQGQNALLFPVGDAEEAAKQLYRLWQDPGLRIKLGLAGQQLVLSRYSIEASVTAWDQAFSNILSSPSHQKTSAVRKRVPAGHLDRWLGISAAESLRRCMGKRNHITSDPGGEWPHSHSAKPNDDPEFWKTAKTMDALEC